MCVGGGGGGQTLKIRKIRKNGQWKEATLTCQGEAGGGGGLSKGRVGGRWHDAWVGKLGEGGC